MIILFFIIHSTVQCSILPRFVECRSKHYSSISKLSLYKKKLLFIFFKYKLY